MQTIVGRSLCRVGSVLWVVGLGAGMLPVETAQAQNCTRVDPPVFNFALDNATGSNTSGSVTADGRVVIVALPNDAPETAAAEVALFNPRTRQLSYITSGTASVVDQFGVNQRFPKRVTGISRDGSVVAISGSGSISFPFLQLPGEPAPAQVTEVVGLGGAAELINTATGARQVIGQLSQVPLASNEFYVGQVSGLTANAGKALLDEFIVRFDVITVDGRPRRIVPQNGFIAGRSGLYDVASGQFIDDIPQRINALVGGQAGIFNTDGASLRMSGDGNAFMFTSNRVLENPLRPLWQQETAAGSRYQTAPYVYYLSQNVIVPVVNISRTQPRAGGSNLIFLRNVGFSGTVFGIERGATYIGATPNPSGANNPATVIPGQVPRYITEPTPQPPARGFFANSFALIAPEEDRVYFTHTADLVPGGNPDMSQEFYSIRLDNRQIRQISAHRDPLAIWFAQEPAVLFQYGANSQIVYAGSSSDHSVVAYSYSQPGGSTRVVKEISGATGRTTTLRAARFGTAEYPAAENFRIMLCQ
ncbi:MAG: hypothetical protein ACT4NL_10735 [Pseudomarimonas sp.]